MTDNTTLLRAGHSDIKRTGIMPTATAPGQSIAVLPFENLSDEKANAFFADGIQNDVLANVVSNEDDDASVVAKITAGEGDAALVYVSDVTSTVAPQVNAVEIPDAVNVIATYPIAVISGSPNADAAQAFVDYVTGPDGQATLADFGFLPPPSS